jgi:hypothetical protein
MWAQPTDGESDSNSQNRLADVQKTFTINAGRMLTCLHNLGENDEMSDYVETQCDSLPRKQKSKSMNWKMRARVGENKRWYQLPEE